MNQFFVHLVYNLLLPLLLLAGLPRFVIKGIQRGGLTRNFAQRLGFFRPDIREKLAQPGNIWIHAVSVGEVLIALKLVTRLLAENPARRVVLSTTTSTGYDLAVGHTAASCERVTVIHNPVDLPWITRSVLDLIQPERLVLVEAEVWPNLVRQTRARGIPVVLVNARLSDRSERRFLAVGPLIRPVFSLLSRVGVPFSGDIPRWAGLGVDPGCINVTGSVKFDEGAAVRPGEQIAGLRQWLETACGIPANARVLLAASTHPGEEAAVARVWLELRQKRPDLALVIVPRHAERARDVARDLRVLGIRPICKNPLPCEPADESHNALPAAVANTTGELRAWYYLAEVVVIGKSLLGHGGQNPVEAVVAGKPVVAGPNMENFRAIVADLLASQGLVQIAGIEELPAAITGILDDPARAAAIARQGLAALDSHRGAADRTVDLILRDD